MGKLAIYKGKGNFESINSGSSHELNKNVHNDGHVQNLGDNFNHLN